jgi:signal transduction histidine kinase
MRPDATIDPEALVQAVERTYAEFDRERRLNDRAAKLMEEELQQANKRIRVLGEQKLAETLESVPSAITLLNASFEVQTINSAMANLCADLPAAPKKGDDFQAVLKGLSPQMHAEDSLKSLLSGGSLELKINGRWYLVAVHALSDGGYALALSDISPLKEREAALAMARDAAESANQLKSKFLATMSHELRTPLNAILGFSEIIRDNALGDSEMMRSKYRDYASSIYSSGSHLLLLISEVLDLSKIESGSYQLYFEPIDLKEMIQESLQLISPLANRGKVTILPLQVQGDMELEADRRAVKQVMVNLLSNAVKFTPAGGEVEIICAEENGALHVSVRDSGIGIAEDLQERVFEPFHQGDAKVARRYEGTGLGLSVCKGLIEMHGGQIRLESTSGIGTTVSFRISKRCQTPLQTVRAA